MGTNENTNGHVRGHSNGSNNSGGNGIPYTNEYNPPQALSPAAEVILRQMAAEQSARQRATSASLLAAEGTISRRGSTGNPPQSRTPGSESRDENTLTSSSPVASGPPSQSPVVNGAGATRVSPSSVRLVTVYRDDLRAAEQEQIEERTAAGNYRGGHIPQPPHLEDERESILREMAQEQFASTRARTAWLVTATQSVAGQAPPEQGPAGDANGGVANGGANTQSEESRHRRNGVNRRGDMNGCFGGDGSMSPRPSPPPSLEEYRARFHGGIADERIAGGPRNLPTGFSAMLPAVARDTIGLDGDGNLNEYLSRHPAAYHSRSMHRTGVDGTPLHDPKVQATTSRKSAPRPAFAPLEEFDYYGCLLGQHESSLRSHDLDAEMKRLFAGFDPRIEIPKGERNAESRGERSREPITPVKMTVGFGGSMYQEDEMNVELPTKQLGNQHPPVPGYPGNYRSPYVSEADFLAEERDLLLWINDRKGAHGAATAQGGAVRQHDASHGPDANAKRAKDKKTSRKERAKTEQTVEDVVDEVLKDKELTSKLRLALKSDDEDSVKKEADDDFWLRVQFADQPLSGLPDSLQWQITTGDCGLLEVTIPKCLADFKVAIEREAGARVMDGYFDCSLPAWLNDHCVEGMTVLWNYGRSGGSSSNSENGGRTVVSGRNLKGVVRALQENWEKHVLLLHYARNNT